MVFVQQRLALHLLIAHNKRRPIAAFIHLQHQQRRMASTLVQKHSFLRELGFQEENHGVFDGREWKGNGPVVESLSPATNEVIARVRTGTPEDYERVASATKAAFRDWAALPAPKRGEIVRQIGDQLRKHLNNLGALVSFKQRKF